MRKHYYKFFSIILTIVCMALSIFVILRKTINLGKNAKKNDLSSKIISEVDYLDSTVIDAMNKLNNISIVRYKVYTKNINKPENNKDDNPKEKKDNQEQQEINGDNIERSNSENIISVSQVVANNSLTETNEEDVNWDEITYIYENIYSVWPTIELDLKKLGMKDEYVNNFNLDLNGIAQSINNKDKKSALVNFYNLYSQLPNYLLAVTEDNYMLTVYNCKLEVLNSYVLANDDNKWKEMSESAAKSKKMLKNMIDEIDERDNKKSNIEKTYAIVNDLENSTILSDKNIFYMQYKNAIQALETM